MSEKIEVGSKIAMEWRTGKSVEIGPTERIRKLNALLHSYRPSLAVSRGRAFTRVYKDPKTQGWPEMKRRYHAVAEAFKTLPVKIFDHEQVLLWASDVPRAANFAPEAQAHWMLPELDEVPTRGFDPFKIDPKDKEELRNEILPFWEHKSLTAKWREIAPEPDKLIGTGIADCINYISNPGSHFIPDYVKIMKVGLKGIKDECQAKLDEINKRTEKYEEAINPSDPEKKVFYEGLIEVLDAVHELCLNYAKEAKRLAKEKHAEGDVKRAEELEVCAKTIEHSPWLPPHSFREAIQTVNVVNMLCNVEGSGPSYSMGRFDRYMYPFYKKDLEEGKITYEEAMDLIEDFYIKVTSNPWLLPTQLAYYFGGYYRFPQVGAGGTDEWRRPVANDISYMVFRAMREVRTTAPSVALYLHPKTPDSLLEEAVKLSAEGMGHPSFFDCLTMYDMLRERGSGHGNQPNYSMEDIYGWGCMIGCVEPGVQGMQWGHTDSGIFNLEGILQMTIFNGVKPKLALGYGAGEQMGPKTGDVNDMKTFDEFVEAYKKQALFHLKELHHHMTIAEKIKAEEHLFPFQSAICEGPIEKGLDVSQGGAAVNVGPVYAAIGIADAANSLAAIKKLIYEDKVCTWDEMKAALEANWEGHEELRKKALACPKYGNDLDYVDMLIAKFLDWYCYEVKSLKCYRGHYADPTIQMVQANVAFGNMAAASPYGRLAQTPLADTISAKAGFDVMGPTAAARTYGKINHSAFNNGTICNMWISKSELIEE